MYASVQYFVTVYAWTPIGACAFFHIFLIGASMGIYWDPKKFSSALTGKHAPILCGLAFIYLLSSSAVKQYLQLFLIDRTRTAHLRPEALGQYFWRDGDSFTNLQLILAEFYYEIYFDPIMIASCSFMIMCAAADIPSTSPFASSIMTTIGKCAYSLYVVHPFMYGAVGWMVCVGWMLWVEWSR